MIDIDSVAFDGHGLVPVVVQDRASGTVLMLGYANRESIEASQATRLVHLWSRSRERLWQKGETSGNVLQLVDMHLDCDGDAILVTATPTGPTCHTGTASCFGSSRADAELAMLETTIAQRMKDRPGGSYTVSLADQGIDAIGRKVVEEATEVLLAAKDHAAGSVDERRVAEEAADLVYHLLVLLADRGSGLQDVAEVLAERRDAAP